MELRFKKSTFRLRSQQTGSLLQKLDQALLRPGQPILFVNKTLHTEHKQNRHTNLEGQKPK